jgi:hypothetical protein
MFRRNMSPSSCQHEAGTKHCYLLHAEDTCSSETSVDFQQSTRCHNPEDRAIHNHNCVTLNSILSTLLHATVYMFSHNLLNALVQIANKMGLKKIQTNTRQYTPHRTCIWRVGGQISVLALRNPLHCFVRFVYENPKADRSFIFVGCILLRYIITLSKYTCNRNWDSSLYFSLFTTCFGSYGPSSGEIQYHLHFLKYHQCYNGSVVL